MLFITVIDIPRIWLTFQHDIYCQGEKILWLSFALQSSVVLFVELWRAYFITFETRLLCNDLNLIP